MKQLILKNKFFLFPYAIVVLGCVILLFLFTKPELHIMLNKANTPFFDIFFKYINTCQE